MSLTQGTVQRITRQLEDKLLLSTTEGTNGEPVSSNAKISITSISSHREPAMALIAPSRTKPGSRNRDVREKISDIRKSEGHLLTGNAIPDSFSYAEINSMARMTLACSSFLST